MDKSDFRIDPEVKALIPEPRQEEVDALETSILEHGCRDALTVWNGILLDGHNRFAICARHAVPYKTSAIDLPDRDRAMLWVQWNQLGRRNLTDDQRSAMAAEVALVEARLSKRDRASKGGETGGRNHPKKVSLGDAVSPKLTDKTRVRTKAAKAAGVPERKVRAAMKLSPAAREKVKAGTVRLMQAVRDEKKAARDKRREIEAAEAEAATAGNDHGVIIGDFREVARTIKPASVELIFTDPPYDRGSLGLYGDLAETANRILHDGGSLICYAGQYLLPDIIPMMQKHLRFWWVCACVHTGQLARMNSYGVIVGWKPLLWFVKGSRADTQSFVPDTILSQREKSEHDWQQGEIDATHFIERLTAKKDLVFDPFCGGGTTAAVCKTLGRRWLTCDLDETAAKKARKRVADAK